MRLHPRAAHNLAHLTKEEIIMSYTNMNGKSVLVTGCSSGIGRATAIYLAHRGFTVFATVRREADAEALRALGEPNLVPVCPLDLSRPEQITAAVTFVKQTLQARNVKGLYAIVNNAGGGVTAPIELMDIGKFRTELETRLLGPIALLQACLPLVREARGRIVWITTPGLMPIPYVSSIHVPDYAVNCLTRTLNLELKKWHIPCIMVRCGTIQTAAPDRTARELQEALHTWSPEQLALYHDILVAQQATLSGMDEKRTPPEEVGRVVYSALSAQWPRSRYAVGHLSRLAAFMELLPQTVVDGIMARRS
jgi:NAD(P)-dependent dehydrogenase (short-subunit alcohol dehydrogenase family)